MNSIDEKKFICEKCDFASDYVIYFKKHSCTQHHRLKSDVSNDGFNNYACASSSLSKQYKSSINTYKCTECGFSCRSKGILKLHNNIHFYGQFKCINCDFLTNFENIYTMHLENCDRSSDSLMKKIKKDVHSCSIPNSKTVSDNESIHSDNTATVTQAPQNHKEIQRGEETHWSHREKLEIYWCDYYSKVLLSHNSKISLNANRRRMLKNRGKISHKKIYRTPSEIFNNIVLNIKVGKTTISKKEIQIIENDVQNYVHSEMKMSKTNYSNGEAQDESKTVTKEFSVVMKKIVEGETQDQPKTVTKESPVVMKKIVEGETQDQPKTVTKESPVVMKKIVEGEAFDQPKPVTKESSVVMKKLVEEISTNKDVKTSNNRYHLCPFCLRKQSNFGRHIRLKHKTEPAVAEALKLPLKQQIKAFAAFRRGVPKLPIANSMKSSKGKVIVPQSVKTSTFVRCKGCQTSYKKSAYIVHEKQCPGSKKECDISPAVVKVPAIIDFNTEIKEKFRNDEIGNFIKGDKMLLEYGTFRCQNYETANIRSTDIRKNLMVTLRRLGCLCVSLKKVLVSNSLSMKTSLDLFKAENFSFLMTALDNVSYAHPMSKLQMVNRLKAYATFVQMSNKSNQTLENSVPMDEFFSFLEENWKDHFDYSQKDLKKRKGKISGKSPLLNKVNKIRNFIIDNLKKLDATNPNQWNLSTFVLARRIIVCRLIFLNVPRGGEPLNLTLKEWEESKSNTEIDLNSLNNVGKKIKNLFKLFKVIYQHRKDHPPFPLLIPKDCVQTINALSNKELRDKCGINDTNDFLFPSTHSNSHVLGWSDISFVCKGAKVFDSMKVYAVRDKTYATFENQEIPKYLQKSFYKFLDTHQ